MLNLIRADFYKLSKSLTIKIIFAITTFSAIAMTAIAYLIPQGKIAESTSGVWFLFSDVNMISILGAVIAGVFICGDFENKTIQDAIANGSSRGTVLISKAIVFCCAIAFVLLPYVIVTGIAFSTNSEFSMGSLAVGFLHLLTAPDSAAAAVSEIWKLLVIMLTLIILYVAQLSVCVPLAIMLKKPVFVIAIYYGLSILLAQLIGIGGVTESILAFTPFGGNYTFMTLATGTEDIIKAISVSLLFILAMLAITYSTFRKAEFK
jgi:ABC-2 type transport system permease protein